MSLYALPVGKKKSLSVTETIQNSNKKIQSEPYGQSSLSWLRFFLDKEGIES